MGAHNINFPVIRKSIPNAFKVLSFLSYGNCQNKIILIIVINAALFLDNPNSCIGQLSTYGNNKRKSNRNRKHLFWIKYYVGMMFGCLLLILECDKTKGIFY